MSSTGAARTLKLFGLVFLFLGLGLFAYIYLPVAKVEVDYTVAPPKVDQPLVPVDTDFGLVIPKIGANTPVVADVDPANSREYEVALTHGVAQAKGTRWFLFAHSAGNWLEANRYNAVFYLLTKMETGDEIDLYYHNQKYVYNVTDKKIVDATDVSYMAGDGDGKTLTLMTCWPPGTTFKRLIVISKLAP